MMKQLFERTVTCLPVVGQIMVAIILADEVCARIRTWRRLRRIERTAASQQPAGFE